MFISDCRSIYKQVVVVMYYGLTTKSTSAT